MSVYEFEQTPNPNALRVNSGEAYTTGATREFDRSTSLDHPLACSLLSISGIERIMLGRDFVTVVREGPHISWESLRSEIVLALMETADAPLAAPRVAAQEPLGEIEQQIEDVLDRYVRPLLAADGGEVVLERFDAEARTAWVRMSGACGGCPSGITTLKRTIEHAIRRWVAEVERVEAVGASHEALGDPKARFRKWIEAKWGAKAGPSRVH